jgi:hypothetical protein
VFRVRRTWRFSRGGSSPHSRRRLQTLGRHHAELTERQSLDAGATLTRGQKRLRRRAAVPFVSRVWHERDAFVSDRDKPAAWNLGSADPIVKHLQFETFRGHLLEDKDFGLEFCHAIS